MDTIIVIVVFLFLNIDKVEKWINLFIKLYDFIKDKKKNAKQGTAKRLK